MSKLSAKEKVFERLKDCVLTLEKEGKNFVKTPDLANKWISNYHKVINEMELLSPKDEKWIDEQYKEWFKTLPKENWDKSSFDLINH